MNCFDRSPRSTGTFSLLLILAIGACTKAPAPGNSTNPVTNAAAPEPTTQLTTEAPVPEANPATPESSRLLPLADFKDKPLLFLRTLSDVPSEFEHAFPGLTGGIHLVQFVFESDAVVVRTLRPLVEQAASDAADLEDLMRVPAIYVRKEDDGRWVPSNSSDPKAIAYVDWTRNSIRTMSASALQELGMCFPQGPASEILSDVVNRSGEGKLSLTLSTTFSVSSKCLSPKYYGVQTVFTFGERVSFKPYVAPSSSSQAMALPFAAQKLLGFGVFTNDKPHPNDFQNFSRQGDFEARPEIHDISSGKKIVYVLSGLPKNDPQLRADLIRATREVIDDWNVGFRKAFAGTPLASRGDVLELGIEGESDAYSPRLGDFEVNRIHYDAKNRGNGLYGIGLNQPNPDSGKIESATVIVYGGNLLSAAEYYKIESERLVKNETPSAEIPQTADSKEPLVMELKSLLPKIQDLTTSRRSTDPVLDSLQRSASVANTQAIGKGLDLAKLLHRALSEGASSDTAALMQMSTEAVLESMDKKIDASEIKQLKAQLQTQQTSAEIRSKLSKAGVCFLEGGEVGVSPEDARVFHALTPHQMLVRMYRLTLVHEIGHTLGLRHNFIASVDKDNWNFHEHEDVTREYSSVMDYLDDIAVSYKGVGPQDVHALRAAYAGYVELQRDSLTKAVKQGDSYVIPAGKVNYPLLAKRFVSLDSYKELLGLKQWSDLTSTDVDRVPIKSYKFCTDEDTYFSPMCDRFDRGTNAPDVVKNTIKNYRALYTLRNFPNKRRTFTWWNRAQYLSQTLRSFLSIRKFLDELYAVGSKGTDSDAIQQYAQASMIGSEFFNAVVRTPDAPENLARHPEKRFLEIKTPSGDLVSAERKWNGDVLSPGSETTLLARGIEIDKALALLILTTREAGGVKNERDLAEGSYVDFERIIATQMVKPIGLPTVSLLNEIIKDEIRPAAINAKGSEFIFPEAFPGVVVEATPMLKFYALDAATTKIQYSSIRNENENLARLFWVHSSLDTPAGKAFVMAPELKSSQREELKYWAAEGAEAIEQIIAKIGVLAAVSDKKSAFDQIVQKWMKDGIREDLSVNSQSLETDLTKVLMAIKNDPRVKGELFDVKQQCEIAKSFLASIKSSLYKIDKVPLADKPTFEELSEELSDQVSSLAKFYPIVETLNLSFQTALAQDPASEDFQSRTLKALKTNHGSTEARKGTLIRYLEVMNRLQTKSLTTRGAQ